MAYEVLIPPLGQTVDTVTLVTWYRKEGEMVQEGELLFAIETDKATLDVEAQASGVLRRVTVPEGQEVEVLSVIALIASPDEEPVSSPPLPARVEEWKSGRMEEVPPPPSFLHSSTPPLFHSGGAGGREVGRTFISPRARRLAETKGVPIENLSATGPEGAIVERDVQAYLDRQPTATEKTPADVGIPSERQTTGVGAPLLNETLAEIPLQGVRAIIAERMIQSVSTTARVTLTAEVDATALVELRQRLAEDGVTVSYNDLFLYVLGRALREQPALNASLEGKTLRQWKRVHIGLAVDAERGLLVPVVRDVDTKGLAQIARETSELIGRVKAGTLTPDELRGGTFTLTNLGMFGIDAFTPIINPPETAILGVGRIKPRPVVREHEVVIRDVVWLSLSFDHRIVDGGPAARFLQRVTELIEHPHLMHT
jgi:pyruvate dehydrogenase E2 component (dihydrolipoamide acetyltransferase)